MTETDDKLLKQFFSEQKQEVKDNGFSRRVMRNLPGRNHRLIQIWGTVCTVLCVILFFAFGGLQATISTLREVLYPWYNTGLRRDSIRNLSISPFWYSLSSEHARHGLWLDAEIIRKPYRDLCATALKTGKNLLSGSGCVIFVNKIHTIYSI